MPNNNNTFVKDDRRIADSFPIRRGRQSQDLGEKRGLSQTHLADMAGIGRAHLSQIENCAVAPASIRLYALAHALEMTSGLAGRSDHFLLLADSVGKREAPDLDHLAGGGWPDTERFDARSGG